MEVNGLLDCHEESTLKWNGSTYKIYDGKYDGVSSIKDGKQAYGPNVFLYENGAQKPIYFLSNAVDTDFIVYDEVTRKYTRGRTTNVLWKRAFTEGSKFPQVDISKVGI